jgi:hypothetical protein
MKDFLSRRSVLAGIGSTAVYGSLASQIAGAGEAAAAAAAPAAQEMVYSTMFMTGPKTKFDPKKYETKHLPLLKKSFGESVSRIEMRTANATARGVPSDIRVETAVYIADLPKFVSALREHSAAINADLDSIATGPRNIQIDRLLLASGAPRSELRESHQVVSTYYKDNTAAPVTFNTAYYTDTYLPKLRSYYGDSAVRRIEVFMGVPQGGAKPAIIAATHLYIRDRDLFNTGNNEGQKELMQIDDKYTNAVQMWADSKVTAIL